MSLCRVALRISAVEAIKGRTLVGGNVLDTPNGALDIQADGSLRTDEEKPFIAVYTDQGKAEGVTGRSLVENGLCDVVFETGVSMAMVETDPDTGVSSLVGVGVPASDSSFEFLLDVVERQIIDALNDPDNSWAEIYRGLHDSVIKIEFAGARNSDDGQRLAGHQKRITVRLVDEPFGGELVPDAPFSRFLDALEASGNASYVEMAATMRAVLSGSQDDLQKLRRKHGLTQDEATALGLTALADDGEEAGTLTVEGPVSVVEVGAS
jgi:hypothetical protein